MNMKWRASSGATIIEILMTMMIFAVGPLAWAKVQWLTQQSNHLTVLRTVAFNQAYNLAEAVHLGVQGSLDQTIVAWNESNARLLPQGNGTVAQDGRRYTITVYWQGTMDQSYCDVESSPGHCIQIAVWR